MCLHLSFCHLLECLLDIAIFLDLLGFTLGLTLLEHELAASHCIHLLFRSLVSMSYTVGLDEAPFSKICAPSLVVCITLPMGCGDPMIDGTRR